MLNAMTIDVEDYYMVSGFADVVSYSDWSGYPSRVARSTGRILDILDEMGVKATFFVLGWIAEHHPGVVREICGRGHEIASHGYSHRLVYEQTPEEFREDIVRAKKVTEDVTGGPVLGYRAPSYSITLKSLWALDILIEEGFLYDSSIFPIYHDRYGYPEFGRFPKMVNGKGGTSLLEIPLTTARIFGKNFPIAGGGYLRLFPLGLIKWGLVKFNRKDGYPAIIYIHPWELDPEQPKISGGRLSNFRHNVNLSKTASKVRDLLRSFAFGPVREVYADMLGEIGE